MLTKQINIMWFIYRCVADELGLTVLLDPFLTRSLSDETGHITLVSHAWRRVLGFWEIISSKLILEFLSTVQFNRDVRVWSDDSTFSFRFGRITEPSDYNYLSVWDLVIKEYVSRLVKESSFISPLHRFMHYAIVATIHHHEEHNKGCSGDVFHMWYLLYNHVHLYIP